MARLGGQKSQHSRNEAEQAQDRMSERHQSDKGQDMQQGEKRSAVRHTGNQQQEHALARHLEAKSPNSRPLLFRIGVL